VVEYLPQIYKLCQDHDIPATFFEITTALAFLYYQKSQTDIVVLETGLGGRLDATNVVRAPALSIITSIGLEHTRILGDTIELIALEKGGIIKQVRPVLVGPNAPHHVLRECASQKSAGPYYTCDEVLGEPDEATKKLLIDYDVENSRTVTAALQILQEQGSIPRLAEECIRKGTSLRPPCRFESCDCGEGLTVILDVAHNPDAMEYMVRKLQATYPDRSCRIVVGMSSDKDLKLNGVSILKAVGGDQSKVHIVEAANPRAATLESILESSGLSGAHYDLDDRSVGKQIKEAIKLARENHEVLVVCGSVFLMSEARESLGFDEPRDSEYIAEMAGAGVKAGQENFGNTRLTP
jgi:dihydrofolate synthase/folylpolyglutamate synthase